MPLVGSFGFRMLILYSIRGLDPNQSAIRVSERIWTAESVPLMVEVCQYLTVTQDGPQSQTVDVSPAAGLTGPLVTPGLTAKHSAVLGIQHSICIASLFRKKKLKPSR